MPSTADSTENEIPSFELTSASVPAGKAPRKKLSQISKFTVGLLPVLYSSFFAPSFFDPIPC